MVLSIAGAGTALVANLASKIVNKVVDRIPDPRAKEEARIELEKELATSLTTLAAAQLEVNKQEAAHKSIFVAGWRPWIGWVCGMSLFWTFFAHPIASWAITLAGLDVAPPDIPIDRLFELVLAMLGMGTLRTFEKLKGVARGQ